MRRLAKGRDPPSTVVPTTYDLPLLKFLGRTLYLIYMPLNKNMSEGACYVNHDARNMAMISLMRTAHRLLSQSSVIVRLTELETLCANGFPLEEFHRFAASMDPPFLDAFRIATAFENLFKAELLGFGYVVHKFDVKAGPLFKQLANQQKTRPIKVTELKAAEGVTWCKRDDFVIAGLTHETIPFGRLISSGSAYSRSLRLSGKLMQALDTTREHRNTVHLVMNDIGRFNINVVENYLVMRDAFNTRLLHRYQRILGRYEHMRDSKGLSLNKI